MNKSNVFSGPSAENLQEGGKVVIFSHDLDNYSTLPLSVRRDFQIKTIRHWFLEDVDSTNKAFAGLRFQEFLGRKVEGYFCPVTSVLACGDFDIEDFKTLKGLTVVQMVPDFEMYKSMAKIVGLMYNLTAVSAKGLMTNDALAQQISEDSLLNVIGLTFAFRQLRNNPLPVTGPIQSIQQYVRDAKVLNQIDGIWKFFHEMQISYSMYRLHENFIGLSNGVRGQKVS